jgi:hypothetical protein
MEISQVTIIFCFHLPSITYVNLFLIIGVNLYRLFDIQLIYISLDNSFRTMDNVDTPRTHRFLKHVSAH